MWFNLKLFKFLETVFIYVYNFWSGKKYVIFLAQNYEKQILYNYYVFFINLIILKKFIFCYVFYKQKYVR